MEDRKIHIFYRHYNISGKENYRPEWFDYEKCYANILNTSINKNVSINVIFDGNYKDNWISNYYKDNIYNIQAGGDTLSFFKTCEIIKNDLLIKENDLIYFLENDYVHLTDWVDKVLDLFNTYNLNGGYITLYSHPDKFTPLYEDLVSKIIVTKNHHWRTTPSTCGSFIVNNKTFLKDYDVLSTMEGDHNKWVWLNENRNRFILSPIPTLSTHCMSEHLAHLVDWEKLSNL